MISRQFLQDGFSRNQINYKEGFFMKRFIMAVILAACMVIPALAQSNSDSSKPIWDHGDNVSEYTYYTTPIYSIMMTREAYVVFYQVQDLSISKVIIPKTWQVAGEGKKLYFRNKTPGLDSYITVFYKEGQFHHVILTANPDMRDPIWKIAPSTAKVDTDGIETLDIKF